jgi:oxygen-independent coproporphyrinogen-3 oxidase
VHDHADETAYCAAIKKEILNIPDKTLLDSLYLGGGTPTILSTVALTQLIAHIFKHFRFESGYEATIEANPGTIDVEKLRVLRSAAPDPVLRNRYGLNRISIGVQSFNDNELSLLGRMHDSVEAEQAVYYSREAGFENIGIDLIYGIPGQSIGSWEKTLARTVSLKPKHISAYELTVKGGTLLDTYIEEGRYLPLEEDKIIELYDFTIDYLSSEGFNQYEISNFSVPDFVCRHSLNYWDRGQYYGAGLGAHSYVKGKRLYNTDDLHKYIKLLSEDKSPVKGADNIPEEKAFAEAIFLGLRKTRGINLRKFCRSYGKDLLNFYQKEIDELCSAGMMEIYSPDKHRGDGQYVRLTRKGLLLSNEIYLKFI